jgi:MFS family permease
MIYFLVVMGVTNYYLIAGLGIGLIYLPAIVCVTCYFEKYRSLATGIAVCGSGLGTFVFAPLTQWLIANLKWQGAMAVMGVLLIKCSLYGILFRPLKAAESRAVSLDEIRPLKVCEIRPRNSV